MVTSTGTPLVSSDASSSIYTRCRRSIITILLPSMCILATSMPSSGRIDIDIDLPRTILSCIVDDMLFPEFNVTLPLVTRVRQSPYLAIDANRFWLLP